VSLKRVHRGIFAPKSDGVVMGWLKLHSADLCNLCSSSYIIRMINQGGRMGGACSTDVS
jgi:hypothetical protein